MKNSIQFSRSPLEVHETEQWDPLEDFSEEEFSYDALNISELETIGAETHHICDQYGVPSTISKDGSLEGMEVGDDRVDWTLDAPRGAATLSVQSLVLKMGTSWRDTNLSDSVWNFCEVSSRVPAGREESFNFCRKVNGFDKLGFTDVPPLRIIMDVRKGDGSHSSTTAGKVSMLASRMRTPRSEHLSVWNLASYLQDGLLQTSRSTEPKYLPEIMGGSGCRAAYQQPDNLYLSVLSYRGGKYSRIYGTATEELRQCLQNLERGEATMPVLCGRLRDKQEYLHATYAEKVFVPRSMLKAEAVGLLPPPLIEASGGSNRYSTYETRLIRTKKVVDFQTATQGFNHSRRIRAQILDPLTSVVESDAIHTGLTKVGRARYWNALSANSAFSNMLNRDATLRDVKALTQEEFLVVNTGVSAFTKWNADWLFAGGKSGDFNVNDLTTMQDLYVRTEVSEEETLKVGGIVLEPFIGRQAKRVVTQARVGLYQINESMDEWSSNLLDKLVNRREEVGRPLKPDEAHQIYEQDTEWVNDDTALIGRCLRETQSLSYRSCRVLLISADKRLANQMANTCQVMVCLVRPTDYITWSVNQRRDIQKPVEPNEILPFMDMRGRTDPFRHVYMDWGSIASFSATLETDETSNHPYRREDVVYRRDLEGRRQTSYNLVRMPSVRQISYRQYHPIERPKRTRYNNQGSLSADRRASAASRHTDWRLRQDDIGSRPSRSTWSNTRSISSVDWSTINRTIPGEWPKSPN